MPHPTTSPALSVALQAHLLQRPEMSAGDRRLVAGAIAGAHLLGLWSILQMPTARDAVRDLAPMMVELVAPPAPPAPAPPQPPAQPIQRTTAPAKPPLAPVQPLLAAPAADTPALQAHTAPPPEPAPVQAVVAAPAAPAPPAPPAQPAQPAPAPPRKVVSANAVRYLVEPPVEVPRASRRAGEHGVVWLRVVVSAQGLPALVQVARSSGHSRLDEQALWAMRQARFKPHTEDGHAIEVEVTAPIEYPLE